MSNSIDRNAIPDPAGYWVLPDGSRQPVADSPGWAERFHNNAFYGWKWEPFSRVIEGSK